MHKIEFDYVINHTASVFMKQWGLRP